MVETSVLYIEDNPENRLLVKRTLEAAGYHVTEAVDGPSGLRAAQESQPDLILLDISLPEVDGYELAQRFLDFPHLDGVPVLAVTANVMKGDKERALGAGCDGYIPKPINIDELPAQIEEALFKEHPDRQPQELRAQDAIREGMEESLQEEPKRPIFSELDWSSLFEADLAEESEVVDAPDFGFGFDGEEAESLTQLEARREALVEETSSGRVDELPSDDGGSGASASQEQEGDEVGPEAGPDSVQDDVFLDLLGDQEEESSPQAAEEPSRPSAEPVVEEAGGEADIQAAIEPADGSGGREDVGVEREEAAIDVQLDREETGSSSEEKGAEESAATVEADEARRERAEQRLAEAVPSSGARRQAKERSLTPESHEALARAMQTLVDELGAEAVAVLENDKVLTSTGQLPGCSLGDLVEVVGKASQASDRLASLLGGKERCREQITDIGEYLVHTLAVDADALMLTAMRASVPLGAARFWIRRSASRVEDVLQDEGAWRE